MTFSDKSVVRNNLSRIFFSNNNYAFVVEKEELDLHLCLAKDRDISIIPIKTISGDKEFNYMKSEYSYGLIPYTIDIYDNNDSKIFPSFRFNSVIDKSIYDSDINSYSKKVYVSQLQPTNLKYDPISVIIYDDIFEPIEVPFSGATVDIKSKFEVTIPDISSHGDMSITVQKYCFIEFALSDNVIDVIKLPSNLSYTSGKIKGTFTKSGIYSIIIEYADGQQIINIFVPYYQRLL